MTMKKNRRLWRSVWDRFGMGVKLPALFFIMALAGILFFSWYGYSTVETQLIINADEELRQAVERIDSYIPSGFQDRARDPALIGEGELRRNHASMHFLADNHSVKNVYTIIEVDGVLHLTASNHIPYFTAYSTETPELLATLRDGQSRYAILNDIYGSFRSYFRRGETEGGNYYLQCADIPLSDLELLRAVQWRHFAVMAGLALIAAFVAGWAMAKVIASPLKMLSDFVETNRRQHFRSGLAMDGGLLPAVANPADEVCLLASNFEQMRLELDVHLVRLQEAMSARERVEGEMRIAGEVQQNLLAKSGVDAPEVEIWGAMNPAKAAGGDFYDYFRLGERHVAFCIGDVSGKGMSAAMFMATTLAIFRPLLRMLWTEKSGPEVILPHLMEVMDGILAEHNQSLMFVTLLAGVMDMPSGRTTLISAGHTPPLLESADGGWEYLSLPTGTLLGAKLGRQFSTREIELRPGQALFLYTDGITEALSATGEFFGNDRLAAELAGLPGGISLREAMESLFATVGDFAAGCEQADDLTALCLRRTPK